MPKLTKRFVEAVEPEDKDVIIFDSETKGFIVKVTPRGKRVYMLYYRTQAGRQRKPSIGEHGKQVTCDEAREIAKQLLAEIQQGNDPSQSRKESRRVLTLAEFEPVYTKRHSNTLKERSRDEKARIWKRHLIPALGNTQLNSIIKKDAARLQQSLKNTPYMANRVIELLRHVLLKANEWDYIDIAENPCSSIKRYKEESRERFLSNDEIALLGDVLRQCELEAVEMPSVILAVRLLILTGCRRMEILALQWKWIDWKAAMIRYPDSKTGKKSVPLNLPALELLKSVERKSGNPYVCVGNGAKGHLVNLQKAWNRIRQRAEIFRLIGLISDHENWDEAQIEKARLESATKIPETLQYYRAMIAKLGIDIDSESMKTVRLHDLRHSFASVGVASGLSLFMVGKLLTHKDTVTTQRYAHIADDPLSAASEMVAGKISGLLSGQQAEILEMAKK